MLTLKTVLKRNNVIKLLLKQRLSTSTRPQLKSKYFIYGSLFTTGLISYGVCEHINQSNVLHQSHDSTWVTWLGEQYEEVIKQNSVARFGRAAVAIVAVFVDYKYSLYGLDGEDQGYWQAKSDCHLRSAIRFRDLCSSNGGVFMKIGQHIGSLEFLFPREYTDTLKCFQYDAPASSMKDVRTVIETDTNMKMGDLFNQFDETPIGAASLAQVHRAVLKDGSIVAVKVQHKLVKKHAFADAIVIEFFVNIAGKLFREFQFQWLVDSIKTNVPLELNFINEGKNCEKMRDVLKEFKYLKVPKIYWKRCTERVLFMEYCEGGIVDDIEYIKKHNLNVNDISTKLGRLYSEMIFVNGLIHCDPHPGNILIRKSATDNQCEVILLDHGLYQPMKDHVRVSYCKLWQSVIGADVEGIKEHSRELGVGDYYGLFACIVAARSWDAIQGGIDKTAQTKKEIQEIEENAVQLVSVITEVLERLPREMIMVFKTNDLLRGLDARLKTKSTSASFITMSKCCLRAVYNDELSKCTTRYGKVKLYYGYQLNSMRLLMYQFTLTSCGTYLMRCISFATSGFSYLTTGLSRITANY